VSLGMPTSSLICSECEGSFIRTWARRQPLYCSLPCRNEAKRRRNLEAFYRRRAKGPRPCNRCGLEAPAGASNCVRCNRTGLTPISNKCTWCKIEFLDRKHRRFCSSKCQDLAASNTSCSIEWRPCKICEKPFYPQMTGRNRWTRKNYCSPACAADGRRDVKRTRQKVRWERLGVSFTEWAEMRRATIDAAEWQCQQCFVPLDPYAKRGSNRAAEADHIVPVSLGGKTEPANLQALCAPCNRQKSARWENCL